MMQVSPDMRPVETRGRVNTKLSMLGALAQALRRLPESVGALLRGPAVPRATEAEAQARVSAYRPVGLSVRRRRRRSPYDHRPPGSKLWRKAQEGKL